MAQARTGTPLRFAGSNRQSRTASMAALSSAVSPLDFPIVTSCARPFSPTSTRTLTSPSMPIRRQRGG